MNDVVLSHFAQQVEDVKDRGGDGANVFDRLQLAQYAGKARVDREESDAQCWLVLEMPNQPLGLHCLPAEDVQRRRDDQHSNLFHS